LALISTAQQLYPESFKWRDPPYEYEHEKLPIEILCGDREIPDMIQSKTPLDQIRQSWQDDIARFSQLRKSYLLY
jgi:uncharacterized protein YbbC (DUF1343 family)